MRGFRNLGAPEQQPRRYSEIAAEFARVAGEWMRRGAEVSLEFERPAVPGIDVMTTPSEFGNGFFGEGSQGDQAAPAASRRMYAEVEVQPGNPQLP